MKKIILYAACVLSLASCKKFLDVNTDPNKAVTVPSKVLLPTTTIGIGWANTNELGRAASVLVQYNAGLANQSLGYDSYNLAGLFDNQWDYEIYAKVVNNLRIIIKQSEATDPAYSGIAKMQLAYIISIATDVWGDVPYSQAGFGLEFPQPRYDKQEDIYQGNAALGITSLFDLVRSGIADMDKVSALKPTTDDLIYGGAVAKWKRAGNSLLLKFANTISGVNPTLAKTVITEVLGSANGYINDNTLDFQVPFASSTGNQNPMYVQDISGSFKNGEMLSSRFLALTKSMNDTVRLAKFYTKKPIPATPTILRFVAYDNGSGVTLPTLATRSEYNTYVVGAAGEAPARLLTNFQMQFILAESAITLGTSGDANALYQAGIKASMAKVGMTTAEINGYFDTNPTIVTLAGTNEEKVKQIITQKYISLVGNGIEAYNDYRRTGYPVLAPATNAAGDNGGKIPLRYVYTSGEGNANPNQPKPTIKTSVKVWWGKAL
ncbi:MAG: SusD/RagB family nutrient-binding outer membrane lipoprotein [Bacteroidota bacterium]